MNSFEIHLNGRLDFAYAWHHHSESHIRSNKQQTQVVSLAYHGIFATFFVRLICTLNW